MSGLSQGLLTTEQLLVSGGDARIALDAQGLNKYGCRPYPDAELLALGSSTASVISPAGFAAAEQLRERLQSGHGNAACIGEWARIRHELLASFELLNAGVELVFATSGTDVHHLVARSCAQLAEGEAGSPLTVIMVEESETGSGVAATLDISNVTTVAVPLRTMTGAPRPLAEIDAEVAECAKLVIAAGGRVLLIMVDQSKTGLIAPSEVCAARLHRQHLGQMDVMVDACQLRLSPSGLRAYLRQGFMVALTGSKFLTGPSFSAALLLSAEDRQRLGLQNQNEAGNIGLLLRWEAALAELRRFNAIPQNVVTEMMQQFASAISHRLNTDPHFEALPVPELSRQPELPGCDSVQSIFPFLLYRRCADGRVPLGREQTQHIYRQLQLDLSGNTEFEFTGLTPCLASLRCQFGQPVVCGSRYGVTVSALRLCLSARLISDAAAQNGIAGVIALALTALDKATVLTRCLPHL